MPTAVLSFAESATDAARQVTVTYHGQGGPGRVELTGAQNYAVDLAMMPAGGLRGLLVLVDTTDAAGAPVTTPITVRRIVNAVTINEPLGPGGALMLADLAPTLGTTALNIITTANAVVHVTALG